jgi:hypothetical protein
VTESILAPAPVLAVVVGAAAGGVLGAAFAVWLRASLPRPGGRPASRGRLVAGSLVRVVVIAMALTALARLAPLALVGALPAFLVGRSVAVHLVAPPAGRAGRTGHTGTRDGDGEGPP